MRRLLLLGAAVGALLGTVNSTGALAAGPGPGKPSSPPGQEQVPPGQAKKADEAQAAAPGQEHVPPGHAEQSAAPQPSESPKPDHAQPAAPKPVTHEKHVAPSQAPEHAPKPAKAALTHGNSAVAQTHVIICHRTGSTSNPYVVINISMSAWLHGHSTHPELNGHNDIVLKQGAKPGEKMPRSACGVPGDINPNDPQRPTPPDKPEDPRPNRPSGSAIPHPGGSTAPQSPGSNGGALGSDPGLDAAVAAEVLETAGAGELPFTGMPLWVAVLAGFWLFGSGLAIRKAFGRPAEEVAQSRDQFTW